MKPAVTISFILGPIISAALTLLTLPVIAWIFVPEDVGRFAILQTLLGLSVTFFSLALHQAYVRHFSEWVDTVSVDFNSRGPSAIVFCLFILFSLPFSGYFSELLFDYDSKAIAFFLYAMILMQIISNSLMYVLRMSEKGFQYALIEVSSKLAFIIIVVFLCYYFNNRSFEYLLIALSASLAISFIISILTNREIFKQFYKNKLYISRIKVLLKFSIPLLLSSVVFISISASERLIIKSLIGFEELAVYAVSTSLAASINVLTTIVISLWHPKIYSIKENTDAVKNIKYTSESVFFVVIVLWFFVYCVSPFLALFLPSRYVDVQYLIVLVVGMPLFYLIAEITGIGIVLSKRTVFSIFSSLVSFLMLLIFNSILIPFIGILGAAVSSLISFFIYFIIRTEISSRIWIPINRVKLYLFSFTLVLLVLLSSYFSNDSSYVYVAWVLFILVAFFSFKESLVFNFNELINRW